MCPKRNMRDGFDPHRDGTYCNRGLFEYSRSARAVAPYKNDCGLRSSPSVAMMLGKMGSGRGTGPYVRT